MIKKTQSQIMQHWGVNNSDTPLVSVRCITYNHEKFIAQALDGFLIQKTTFPFEVIVHDDASTDKTAEIIREYERKYPKIIKPIYETENQWSKHDGSVGRIVNNACKGKYIAFCEGDDYWIDRYKLQKQIKFLEKHSDYGMSYTQSYLFYQNNNKLSLKRNGRKIYSYEDLFVNGNKVPTLTVCVRRNLYKQYITDIHFVNRKWAMGDYPLWLYLAKNSRIHYYRRITGVYRILNESASHSENSSKTIEFNNSKMRILQFFAEKYNDDFFYDELNLLVNYKKAYHEGDRNAIKSKYKSLPCVSKNFKNFVIYMAAKTKITFYLLRKFYK